MAPVQGFKLAPDATAIARGYRRKANKVLAGLLCGADTQFGMKSILHSVKDDGGKLPKHRKGLATTAAKRPICAASIPLQTPGAHEYRFIADGVWRDNPAAQQRITKSMGSENCVKTVDVEVIAGSMQRQGIAVLRGTTV